MVGSFWIRWAAALSVFTLVNFVGIALLYRLTDRSAIPSNADALSTDLMHGSWVVSSRSGQSRAAWLFEGAVWTFFNNGEVKHGWGMFGGEEKLKWYTTGNTIAIGGEVFTVSDNGSYKRELINRDSSLSIKLIQTPREQFMSTYLSDSLGWFVAGAIPFVLTALLSLRWV